MEFVQPIRDKKKIQQLKAILKGRNYRDYALFILGINLGLRVSDLLGLKVSHVLDEEDRIKDRITIREDKTGKVKDFPVEETAKKALKKYLGDTKNLDNEGYLFLPERRITASFPESKPIGS
jgi:integrase